MLNNLSHTIIYHAFSVNMANNFSEDFFSWHSVWRQDNFRQYTITVQLSELYMYDFCIRCGISIDCINTCLNIGQAQADTLLDYEMLPLCTTTTVSLKTVSSVNTRSKLCFFLFLIVFQCLYITILSWFLAMLLLICVLLFISLYCYKLILSCNS